MKDLTKWTSECEVSNLDQGEKMIDFCIKRLLLDRKHRLSDEVVPGMIFEELLGGLAAGKAAIARIMEDEDY